MNHSLTIIATIVLAGFLLSSAPASPAAEAEGRWGARLEGGLWKLTEGYWDHSNVDNFMGLSIRRRISPYWLTELSYRYGTVSPGVDDPAQNARWTTNAFHNLYTELQNSTLNIQYFFLPEARISPFMGFGLGLTAWRVMITQKDASFFPKGTTVQGFDSDGDRYRALKSVNFTLALELGAEWFVSERFSLCLGGRYHVLPTNNLDNVGLSSRDAFGGNPTYVDANRSVVQGFMGVTWWFGEPSAWTPDAQPSPLPPRLIPPPVPEPTPEPEPEPDPMPEPEPVADPLPEPEPVPEPEVKAPDIGEILTVVTFAFGSAQLTSESMAALTSIAELLAVHGQIRVEAHGHTCSTGTVELNRVLSQQRAVAVRDALIRQGVAPNRVTAVGYGLNRPIATNATREGRAQNRRVELHRVP